VRTKHGASRLARQLERDGLKTTAIHGDKSQAARLEALDDFKQAKVQVMVATDVAARGLDIEELPLVVNYEMPYVPEDYIHRIGRTARAGATGEAVSLCSPDEEKLLTEIERLLKRSIPVATMDGAKLDSSPQREQRDLHRAGEQRDVRRPRAAPRDEHHYRERPRADGSGEIDDRNPDQPLPSAMPSRPESHAALTTFAAAARPSLRKPQPIPALLMKRPAREPENA
jgi:ATP-dependent RNA helicase RhlE